jgi:hypothetical protein
MLRSTGQRRIIGRSGRPEDFSEVKARRLAEHARAEEARRRAVAEVAGQRGRLERVRLSDAGREALLDLYAAGLALVATDPSASAGSRDDVIVQVPGHDVVLRIRSTPGSGTTVASPSGRLVLVDRTLAVEPASLGPGGVGGGLGEAVSSRSGVGDSGGSRRLAGDEADSDVEEVS